ncbi:unnamed protein product [Pedinophyceae sp. YPF-701]|nr:unnamed protein product [Pedinophyceae sp. YPF-701]
MPPQTINVGPSPSVEEARLLISELCADFYKWGWASGTGGGISVKAADGRIVMAPSGVMKERMQPEDMFVLDSDGNVIEEPAPKHGKPPKLSECSPLFMSAYKLRGAGAVMHSHSLNAVMATMLDPSAEEFRVTELEMIKGIIGHTYFGGCSVPIIENTARECELTERLQAAIKLYPEANAVLVRRHGVYVWGPDWVKAKTQAECYDYLFQAALEMRKLGVDASVAPKQLVDPDGVIARAKEQEGANGHAKANGSRKRPRSAVRPKCVVLDIEGTIAPLTFVSDVLFPYARANLRRHLEETFDMAETKEDIELMREQCAKDVAAGLPGCEELPGKRAPKAKVVAAVAAAAERMMDGDRKTTALKALQGHVWRTGYAAGELKGDLTSDTGPALAAWAAAGVKTYIYSSGSREAQRLLFAHSNAGDVRQYISGYFDTTSGAKVEAASYRNIALSLGVDASDEILFATDSAAEAEAATAAGWRAVLVDRPGNKPLPAKLPRGVPVVKDVTGLLDVC